MQEEHSSSVDHQSSFCETSDTGDVSFKCPLCCTMTFTTRETLAEHLCYTITNLTCSICTNKFTSIPQLIDHLSLENCVQPQKSEPDQLRTILLENAPSESNDLQANNTVLLGYKSDSDLNSTSLLIPQGSVSTQDTESEDQVYTHIMKPLPPQELFVKEGESQYMILAQDQDGPIVTKQNNDGTISLTSVKDMKMEVSEADPLLSQEAAEDSDDGLYSCNTCGVSFTSVIEHIQNYHNDQDVVVEEPMDDDQLPIEYDITIEKHVPRRVITDTGDIVEAPLEKTSSEDSQPEFETAPPEIEPEKAAGPGSKRYLRMNNICDSVIMDLKADPKKGPNHKVMIKEVMTKEGEKIKMYHCMFCNVYVSALNDFKQHPCKTSKYSCLQCPVSYDNAKSLCAHMKVHKVKTGNLEVIESYECDICGTVFPTNKSLKLHRRMHDPVKQRQIEAPRNSSFSDMRFRCSICEKLIPIDYREIHNNSHKNEEKMLNCGICNKKFTSEEYLEMHMNVHNLEKAPMSKQDQSLPYQCLYCDRRFARPHEKVKHERIHTGEKPHSCEICGKSFRVSYCLTLHMRTHTGARPYACQHCGKRFKAHSVYNHHLLTHSDVRAYKCPFCPKAFKTSVQLAGHKNSHTKPFSCTQCNRPFASLYAVRVHTETHNRANNLKFSCALCGASYARAFALKDHMKQAHKQDIKKEILTEQNDWVIQPQGAAEDAEIKSNLQSLNRDIGVAMNQLVDEPPSEFIGP